VIIRSTSSNIATGSSRVRQHCQRSSVAAPLTSRGPHYSESIPPALITPASYGRRLACLHWIATQGRPPGSCKEEHPVTARKNTESHRLASSHTEAFTHHWAGAPDSRQRALFRAPLSPVCYEEDVTLSSLLLAQANHHKRSFCRCEAGMLSFPDRLWF
jgi:hypothetical protein